MSGFFFALTAMAVAGLLSMGIADVGAAANAKAQATTAADAAALAGAAAGHDEATQMAAKNNAELVSVATIDATTTVVVRVGNAVATAHAERILVPIR